MMARKLYRFSGLLMVVATRARPDALARLRHRQGTAQLLAAREDRARRVAIGYHHACRSLLRKFEEFANVRSERWFRMFNESAVVLFTAIVVLVVVKPFSS